MPAGALGRYFFIVGKHAQSPLSLGAGGGVKCIHVRSVPTVRLSLSRELFSILQQRPVQLDTASLLSPARSLPWPPVGSTQTSRIAQALSLRLDAFL